jgi:hypothetical protein
MAREVVDAVRVVGVQVREEHRVGPRDVGGEQLEPKLRRRVDENDRAAVRLDGGADAGSLVTRIRRPADRTAAPELWNAEARARAQEGELHRRRAAARRHLIPSRL